MSINAVKWKVECRERNRVDRTPWGKWELCEGTEGLTKADCDRFAARWAREDEIGAPWLRTEYRVRCQVSGTP